MSDWFGTSASRGLGREPVGGGPTFVLVPGAWLGAWSWHPLAAQLAQRGAGVVALTLPGLEYGQSPRQLRLADAIQHIVDVVENLDLNAVTLVAHSWGGYPATGAAHRLVARLAGVVYYNAVVPLPGVAMVDENAECGAIIRAAVEQSPDRTVTVPFEALAPSLLAGEDPAVQHVFISMTVPQPGDYMLDSLDVGPVTEVDIPASYPWSSDTGLARPGREFAARLGSNRARYRAVTWACSPARLISSSHSSTRRGARSMLNAAGVADYCRTSRVSAIG